MIKSDVQLDAKGLACPMPIVKTKKAMMNVEEGQVLEIIATDKGSVADLAAWSKTVGHQYIGSTEIEGVFHHYIRKCNTNKSDSEEKVYEKTVGNEEVLLNNAIIIDVREEAEYAFGHIPGAINIPFGQLENKMSELDKEATIYVVCRTATRSDMAASTLANAGFTNVFNVVPGMKDYQGQLNKKI